MSDAHTPGPDEKQNKKNSQEDENLFDPSLFDEEEEISLADDEIDIEDGEIDIENDPIPLEQQPQFSGEDEFGADLEGIMERLESTDIHADLDFSAEDDNGDEELLDLSAEEPLPEEETQLRADYDKNDAEDPDENWSDAAEFTPMTEDSDNSEALATAGDSDESELEPGAVDDWLNSELSSALDVNELDFSEAQAADNESEQTLELGGDEEFTAFEGSDEPSFGADTDFSADETDESELAINFDDAASPSDEDTFSEEAPEAEAASMQDELSWDDDAGSNLAAGELESSDLSRSETEADDFESMESESDDFGAPAFDDTRIEPSFGLDSETDSWAADSEAPDTAFGLNEAESEGSDQETDWTASADDTFDPASAMPEETPKDSDTASASAWEDEVSDLDQALDQSSPPAWNETPAEESYGAGDEFAATADDVTPSDTDDDLAFLKDQDDFTDDYAPARPQPSQARTDVLAPDESQARSGGAVWALWVLLLAGAGGGFWYGNQLSSQIGDLRTQVKSLDQETQNAATIGRQVNAHQSDLQNLRQRIHELTQSAGSFNIPANIETQLNQNLHRMDELLRTEERIENRLNSLEREVAARTPRPMTTAPIAQSATETPAAATSPAAAIPVAGGTLVMLQEQIQELRTDVTELRRRDSSTELEALDQELSQALATIEAAEKSGVELRQDLVSVRKELGLIKDDTQSLEANTETVDRRLGDIASRVAMMDDNLETLAENQQRLGAQAADKETLAKFEQTLRQELESLQHELTKLRGEGVQARVADTDRAAALDRRLNDLSAKIALMDERMESLDVAQVAATPAGQPKTSSAVRIADRQGAASEAEQPAAPASPATPQAEATPAESQPPKPASETAATKPSAAAREDRPAAPTTAQTAPAAVAQTTPAAAAQTTPAAAAPPTPAPARTGDWGVNLLSFNTRAGAEQGREEVNREYNINTVIREATVNGATWYRLRVEGFASSAEVKKFIQEHREQAPFDGAWISKNG